METSEMASFASNMGGNILTVVIVGGGYMLYKVCGGSKCGYTSQEGFKISFGDTDDEDSDDEEDKHIKDMMKLMIKRKSIKVQQKKKTNSDTSERIPTIRIPIENSPKTVDEIIQFKSDI